MKDKDQNRKIILLLVVIGVLVGYISLDKIVGAYNNRLTRAREEGFQAGMGNVLGAVVQQTADCQVATLTVGNFTRQVADVQCIQQAFEQAQAAQQQQEAQQPVQTPEIRE